MRRERPHPGAQLRLWGHNGMRHQVVLTNQTGDPVTLELRHRPPRPSREPDQEPQGLRPRTDAVHIIYRQRRVVGDGPRRRRSARLNTDPAAHRRARRRRATHPALPDPSHRRPVDPQRPTDLAATLRTLAMGQRSARRVPASRHHHLTRRQNPPIDTTPSIRAPQHENRPAYCVSDHRNQQPNSPTAESPNEHRDHSEQAPIQDLNQSRERSELSESPRLHNWGTLLSAIDPARYMSISMPVSIVL